MCVSVALCRLLFCDKRGDVRRGSEALCEAVRKCSTTCVCRCALGSMGGGGGGVLIMTTHARAIATIDLASPIRIPYRGRLGAEQCSHRSDCLWPPYSSSSTSPFCSTEEAGPKRFFPSYRPQPSSGQATFYSSSWISLSPSPCNSMIRKPPHHTIIIFNSSHFASENTSTVCTFLIRQTE